MKDVYVGKGGLAVITLSDGTSMDLDVSDWEVEITVDTTDITGEKCEGFKRFEPVVKEWKATCRTFVKEGYPIGLAKSVWSIDKNGKVKIDYYTVSLKLAYFNNKGDIWYYLGKIIAKNIKFRLEAKGVITSVITGKGTGALQIASEGANIL